MSGKFPLSLATLLITLCPLSAADWHQWRGPDRNGTVNTGPRLLDHFPARGIHQQWYTDSETIPGIENGGWSSPVIANNRVYLFTHQKTRLGKGSLPPRKFPYLSPEKRVGMSEEEYAEYEKNRRDEDEKNSQNFRYNEQLYCLHAAKGQLLWTNDRKSVYTRFSQSGCPTVVGGRILVLGAGRLARAIDAATGKDIWQTRLPGEFRDQFLQSSFLVIDRTAIILAGSLFGLSMDDGAILWQQGDLDAGSLHSSPIPWQSPQGTVVISNMPGGKTIAVKPDDGSLIWTIDSEAGHATPLVSGDKLITYGSSRKKGLRCYQLDMATPKHLWTYQGTADSGSSPVAMDGNIFVQGERRLACVALETGKPHWNTLLDLNQPRYTSLLAADGKIFYGFDGLLVFRASEKRFEPLVKGKIDNKGVLADEEAFREKMGINKLETTAEGQRTAEQLWRKTFINGPLTCTTPALSDGRIYIRLKKGVACYDLRARK
ncbi:MAG: PQQ-like beta-propeller repeat protein [Pirellulaceae bacterium]|nr:PQQ-like beta-propeller repeat protein [Pirellulaceae bacterium]